MLMYGLCIYRFFPFCVQILWLLYMNRMVRLYLLFVWFICRRRVAYSSSSDVENDEETQQRCASIGRKSHASTGSRRLSASVLPLPPPLPPPPPPALSQKQPSDSSSNEHQLQHTPSSCEASDQMTPGVSRFSSSTSTSGGLLMMSRMSTCCWSWLDLP